MYLYWACNECNVDFVKLVIENRFGKKLFSQKAIHTDLKSCKKIKDQFFCSEFRIHLRGVIEFLCFELYYLLESFFKKKYSNFVGFCLRSRIFWNNFPTSIRPIYVAKNRAAAARGIKQQTIKFCFLAIHDARCAQKMQICNRAHDNYMHPSIYYNIYK